MCVCVNVDLVTSTLQTGIREGVQVHVHSHCLNIQSYIPTTPLILYCSLLSPLCECGRVFACICVVEREKEGKGKQRVRTGECFLRMQILIAAAA